MDTASEVDRLDALRELRILDTERESLYDDICLVAANLAQAPIAVLTLVDEERQWFKARVGLSVPETPRSIAFCDHTIRTAQPFVVEDAWADPRFCQNPLVLGPPTIRFYAGIPLQLPEGSVPGALAVIDIVPRTLDRFQMTGLSALGRVTVQALVARRALGERA